MSRRILYLHGFASGPGSHKANFFRERLRDAGVDLEVPDLAQDGFEILTITGQLAVLTRAALNSPVSLIGSSMGGYLAALYAARHAQVERLLLLAPAFGFARRWPQTLGEEQVRRWKQDGFREVFHYAERCPRKIGYQILEDGQRYEDEPAFGQPAWIFHGARDTTVPVSFSQEFAARHPNARLTILESDHELLNVLEQIWGEAKSFLVD
jgi:hypothetical protein